MRVANRRTVFKVWTCTSDGCIETEENRTQMVGKLTGEKTIGLQQMELMCEESRELGRDNIKVYISIATCIYRLKEWIHLRSKGEKREKNRRLECDKHIFHF